MKIDFPGIGQRLRAYRIGAFLTADQIAETLGISRAAVYRMEKGEIVKIETLDRLADLLGVSLASLLGVEVEYYSNALACFERMRQLESESVRILAHFQPMSFLLTSEAYAGHLKQMLLESIPADADRAREIETIERIISILSERKASYDERRQPIVSLIGLRELERFVHVGLVGHLNVDDEVRAERIALARNEVLRIAKFMEDEPIGTQIGLVDDHMPGVTFQIFQGIERTHVSVSPFRLGEMPNIRTGIATVTSSPDAINLYEKMVQTLWQRAYKGATGARKIHELLNSL
jgi:transcriptional regulator with XRE-family HTH domain